MTKTRIFLAIAAILLLAVALAGCGQDPEGEPGTITGRVYLDENANAECEECDCDFYLEGITIRIYAGNCGGLAYQETVTDAEGVFVFPEMAPGEYCVSPKVKTICEGYQPTTPIQQKVTLLPGETVEVDWFGFDNNLDIRD
jgi:hypothetical protein